MGGALSSNFSWDSPPGPSQDAWGFVPPGLKPSQHIWSELYAGEQWHPPAPAARNGVYPDSGGMESNYSVQKYGFLGQQRDVMQTFGLPLTGAHQPTTGWTSGTSLPNASKWSYNPVVSFPNANDQSWPPMTGVGNVCTPENYPACDMTEWRQGNDKQPQLWQQWWSNLYTQQNQVNVANSPVTSFNVSPLTDPVNLPDLWLNKVNAVTANYMAGGMDALDSVNTQDTSTYDPCSGGTLLDLLIPLFTGGAMFYLPNKFFFSLLGTLPPEAKAILDLTLFSVGYDLGKLTIASSFVGGDPRAVKHFQEAAANALTLGAGAVGGQLAIPYVMDNPSPVTVYGAMGAAAFVLNNALSAPIAKSFIPGSIGLGFIGTVVKLLDAISNLFCRFNHFGDLACDNSVKFPDARKWDVPSIAAKLTDLACASEGWNRDDPRAEFVYRGLVTSPALMWSATQPNSIDSSSLYSTTHVNPLGSWLPVKDSIGSQINAAPNSTDVNYLQNIIVGEYSSITGETNNIHGWYGTASDHNRYACNNFDVIFQGIEAGVAGETEAETASQKSKDAILAGNLQSWLQALVEKAHNPNNLRAQGLIPGLNSKNARTPNWEVDEATFLKTCADNFTPSTGTGFNDIKFRGTYAMNYPNDPDNLDNVLVQANCYFAVDDEWTAYQQAQKQGWNAQSLTALVHYWHAPKGDIQRISFESWRRDHQEPVLREELERISKGFTVPPSDMTLPFKPMKPADTPLTGLMQPLTKTQKPLTELEDPRAWKHTLLPLQGLDPANNAPTPAEDFVKLGLKYIAAANETAYMDLLNTVIGNQYEWETYMLKGDIWGYRALVLDAYAEQWAQQSDFNRTMEWGFQKLNSPNSAVEAISLDLQHGLMQPVYAFLGQEQQLVIQNNWNLK